MSSIVFTGDTSGTITVSAPAEAGTRTITLPAATGTAVLEDASNNFSFSYVYCYAHVHAPLNVLSDGTTLSSTIS